MYGGGSRDPLVYFPPPIARSTLWPHHPKKWKHATSQGSDGGHLTPRGHPTSRPLKGVRKSGVHGFPYLSDGGRLKSATPFSDLDFHPHPRWGSDDPPHRQKQISWNKELELGGGSYAGIRYIKNLPYNAPPIRFRQPCGRNVKLLAATHCHAKHLRHSVLTFWGLFAACCNKMGSGSWKWAWAGAPRGPCGAILAHLRPTLDTFLSTFRLI